jgi:hypothetical protein
MVEIPWFGGFINGACDTTTLGTVNGNLEIVETFEFIQWLVPARKKGKKRLHAMYSLMPSKDNTFY